MANPTILAAFLLLALLAGASATRTTITTTTIVEDGEVISTTTGRCEQMSMQKMMPCMMYLKDMTRQSIDPMPEQLRMCCSQLKTMDEQCVCESLEMMMMKQKEKGEYRGQEMQKMMQEAMKIPGRCDMSPKQCKFHMLSL